MRAAVARCAARADDAAALPFPTAAAGWLPGTFLHVFIVPQRSTYLHWDHEHCAVWLVCVFSSARPARSCCHSRAVHTASQPGLSHGHAVGYSLPALKPQINENKALSKNKRWTPYGKPGAQAKCQVCKSALHQEGIYCHTCAYQKGLCSMCGKQVRGAACCRARGIAGGWGHGVGLCMPCCVPCSHARSRAFFACCCSSQVAREHALQSCVHYAHHCTALRRSSM